MRKILQFNLKILAKLVLIKYKPKVVGITGSVGKTTTKEAVFKTLSKKFKVGKSLKNYNNEIGLPLSILGFESPGKNILGWALLFLEGFKMLIKKNSFYPEILVLEMGVDKPGDMDYLNSIVKCDIGVVTGIGISHLENFGTIDRIKKEKSKIITNLSKKGLAIINYDNEKSREIIDLSKARVFTYGLSDKSQIKADEIKFKFDYENTGFSGVSFKIRHQGAVVPVFIKGSIGYHLIYSSLVAAVVGQEFGMNLLEISEALREFRSPKGRLNILKALNGAIIIDDTYNSSPQSTIKSLEMINEIEREGGRKIVVLGDMLELGESSLDEHFKIGGLIAKMKIDKLFCTGKLAKNICSGALKSKMRKEDILYFEDQAELTKLLTRTLSRNDLVLIKGSQGARMEKITKEVLKDKSKAKDFLVRQEEDWINT